MAPLLDKIVDLGSDFLYSLLGDVGIGLFNFALKADRSNVELNSFLSSNNALCFLEILTIAKIAKENNLDLAFKAIANEARTAVVDLDSIAISKEDRRYARFMNKEQKDIIRFSRKEHALSSVFFRTKIAKSFNAFPNRLDFLEVIKTYEKIYNRYFSLGCEELAFKVNTVLKKLKDDFVGFKRMSIFDAACFLAKINGFISYENNILINTQRASYQFVPTIYPYEQVKKFASEEVSNIINKIESDALFDEYLVIVPSFGACFKKLEEKINTPNRVDDLKILEKNLLKSLVLGDRDGDCYFICSWT